MRAIFSIALVVACARVAMADESMAPSRGGETKARLRQPTASGTAARSQPRQSHDAKQDHVQQAAEHLRAAGMADEAEHVELVAKREAPQGGDGAPAALVTAKQLAAQFHIIEVNRTLLAKVKGLPSPDAMASDALLYDPAAPVTGAESIRSAVVGKDSKVFERLKEWIDADIAKVIGDPLLVTFSGRQAKFHDGGEVPVPRLKDDGKIEKIEYRKFGTEVEWSPTVVGNGKTRMNVRIGLSSVQGETTVGQFTVPAIVSREVQSSLDLAPGETGVLGGLRQQRRITERIQKVASKNLLEIGRKQVIVRDQETELIVLIALRDPAAANTKVGKLPARDSVPR